MSFINVVSSDPLFVTECRCHQRRCLSGRAADPMLVVGSGTAAIAAGRLRRAYRTHPLSYQRCRRNTWKTSRTPSATGNRGRLRDGDGDETQRENRRTISRCYNAIGREVPDHEFGKQ